MKSSERVTRSWPCSQCQENQILNISHRYRGDCSKTNDGIELEKVEDFKYLGSWVDSNNKDIKIRKAQASHALNRMNCMWNSNMRKEIKVRFFVAAIECIFLYSCES